jgi:hypothetical protein
MAAVHYRQSDRSRIAHEALFGSGGVFRKKSRILAFEAPEDFTIETDRGVMSGVAGDWIVTNHPEDAPQSDVWSISALVMAATYEPAT